jgi:two-component system OmpR family response regulator
MTGQKILVVEDDATLLGVLKYNLEKDGFQVITAEDGVKAVEEARAQLPSLIILDIMLPQLNGYEVCRILRNEMTVPVLMLTAKVSEVDKVVGLELGADDYVTKPFSISELMARIRALLRRGMLLKENGEVTSTLKSGNLELDIGRHRATLNDNKVELSPKEFDLLAYLMKYRGRVYNRDFLLKQIWGYEYAGDSRTVDVHMRWLRKKIEIDPDHPQRLVTVRGVGYKFEE